MKPVLAVTRRLPDAVAKRASETYDIRTQEDDDPLSRNEILALCHGANAALVSVGDPIDADFFDELPDSVKIIATFSVGTDHIDLDAARKKGVCF